jgi:hypothetical protein
MPPCCRCRAAPYEACEKIAGRVSSLSLVRYRSNDYSVPTQYGHRQVWVKVLLVGDPGTGKSHLATGLAIAACRQRKRVRFTTAAAWSTSSSKRSGNRA